MNRTRAACKRFAEKAPPACCGEARTHSRRKPKAESTARPKPASGRMHCSSFTTKTGAKKTPEKRLHRTVSGALLLSNQERNQGGFRGAGSAIERSAARTAADGTRAACKRFARKLLRRSPRPSAPQAASQKPKAKSQKPRPAQPHGPSFRGLAGRFQGLSRNRPKAWFLPPQTRPKPASGRMHCSSFTTKTGAKKTPEKRLHRTVSGALLLSNL